MTLVAYAGDDFVTYHSIVLLSDYYNQQCDETKMILKPRCLEHELSCVNVAC